MLKEKINHIENQPESNQWFDDMISNLRVDQLLLQSDVLAKHKKVVYEAMIDGDQDFMHNYARKTSSAFFIKNLINSYFIQLGERKARPNRVALELSDSKVLVWAEIENDDELTEDALILSAAKVNYEFSKFGFHISSTIVEVDDMLNVPKHYKEVLIKEIQSGVV
jgi:hypothetical protein